MEKVERILREEFESDKNFYDGKESKIAHALNYLEETGKLNRSQVIQLLKKINRGEL